jgi:predicted DsbA family dithiol-disulfide isomerase
MAVERRTVVLLTPDRFAKNPPGAEHVEHQQAEGDPSDTAAPKRRSTDDRSGRDRHRPPGRDHDRGAPTVAPGTIQLWTDLLCPFAHVAVHRLRETRERLGLGGRSGSTTTSSPSSCSTAPPRRGTDTEAVGLGQVAPEAGFRVWTGADDLYPHTVLLAAEAVLAAKWQSMDAAEALDAALRRAFWVAVALDRPPPGHPRRRRRGRRPDDGNAVLDVDQLTDALDSGRHRSALMADFAIARTDAVPGSPTLRLPDGSTVHNPGMTVHWEGPWASGYPIVDVDDPQVYEDLLRRAAGRGSRTAP